MIAFCHLKATFSFVDQAIWLELLQFADFANKLLYTRQTLGA